MRARPENLQILVQRAIPLQYSRYIFLCGEGTGIRKFLADLHALVTYGTSSRTPPDSPTLNLLITSAGIKKLLPLDIVERFESAFVDGPQPSSLGDVPRSRSSSDNWWEGCFETDQVDLVLIIHARGSAEIFEFSDRLLGLAGQSEVTELLPRTDGTRLDGFAFDGRRLHFGYVDGLSSFKIAWAGDEDSEDAVNFRHFLLGYSTPKVQSFPQASSLVRDSSYVVLRWIYQDVAGFERYLLETAQRLFPALPSAHAKELLAAKMMGRWRDGTPLVLSPDAPKPDLAMSDFSYAHDQRGLLCPHSAHIRVVNPRDQELTPLAAVDGVPRILRRGMPYGPPLVGESDDGVDRGIIGLFICSNIRRQFITMMRWMNRNDFSPSFNARGNRQDPLFGNRSIFDAASEFIIPSDEGDMVAASLPDFITTKGTLFCIIPSKTMLHELASS